MLEGGAILPFGEHKGYALGVLIELISGGLSGVGFPLFPNYRGDQGTVLTAVNIAAFQAVEEFKRNVAEFAAHLKATPRAAGFDEILLPGELEWRTRRERLRTGIPLPEATWTKIQATAATAGITL